MEFGGENCLRRATLWSAVSGKLTEIPCFLLPEVQHDCGFHHTVISLLWPHSSHHPAVGSLTDGAFLWFHCRHYFPIVIRSSPSRGYIRAVTLLYYITAITFRGYTTTLLWLHHPHAPPVFVSGSHHAPITFRGLCITQVISHNQCLLKLVGQDHSIQFYAIWRPI